ncbi:MAG: CoA pyrophosphatase [Elusimicrobia bacterium]|nr:CoA pyrophosphatase [Elusimicrobiota bacterium]
MDIDAVRKALGARAPVRLREPRARRAAVALVLVPGRKGLHGLFIRRARHPKDPWSGQIGLPGGRHEGVDRSLFHTAVRETAEETGVRLSQAHLLGELDDLHPRSRSLPDIVVRPFVFALPERPAVVASDEVAYPLWLSLAALRETPGTAYPRVRGRRFEVPCRRAGRHMVWGMTHRILERLIAG